MHNNSLLHGHHLRLLLIRHKQKLRILVKHSIIHTLDHLNLSPCLLQTLQAPNFHHIRLRHHHHVNPLIREFHLPHRRLKRLNLLHLFRLSDIPNRDLPILMPGCQDDAIGVDLEG